MGHIDLLDTISYFEVPEKDARKVMTQLSGIRYKGRIVRCNSEDDKDVPAAKGNKAHGTHGADKAYKPHKAYKRDDWRELMNPRKRDLKGEIPDFTEEGWARRKPRKKK